MPEDTLPPVIPEPGSEPPPEPNALALEREFAEARAEIFTRFALDDQRSYYEYRVRTNREAARGVNFLRAGFTLIAALASIVASVLVSTSVGQTCATNPSDSTCQVLSILAIIAILAPAFGAGFTMLADLYQWNRMVQVYEVALENLAVADAETPFSKMTTYQYIASQKTFSEGTLSVMKDEQSQWGTLIRTPPKVDQFLEDSERRGREIIEQTQNLILRRSGGSSTPPTPIIPPDDGGSG